MSLYFINSLKKPIANIVQKLYDCFCAVFLPYFCIENRVGALKDLHYCLLQAVQGLGKSVSSGKSLVIAVCVFLLSESFCVFFRAC